MMILLHYKNTKIGEFERSSSITSRANSLNALNVVQADNSLIEIFGKKINCQSHLNSKEKKGSS